MPFIANTAEQQKQMLAEMGLTMEKLFSDIPKGLLCGQLNLPEGLPEQEVRDRPHAFLRRRLL
jgi:glycine cleavage system pyridoxal-binding protein P